MRLGYNDRSFQGGQMTNFDAVFQQLREERHRAQSELERLDQAITAIESLGTTNPTGLKRGRRRRTLSPEARRRIAEAQRRRWAKVKGKVRKTGKRALSPAARRRIVAAQKARWAKFRAAKKH